MSDNEWCARVCAGERAPVSRVAGVTCPNYVGRNGGGEFHNRGAGMAAGVCILQRGCTARVSLPRTENSLAVVRGVREGERRRGVREGERRGYVRSIKPPSSLPVLCVASRATAAEEEAARVA